MADTFSITNNTKGNPPIGGLPFQAIKDEVLGKDYELELIFIDEEESEAINTQYRNKNKPTNILSFPLSNESGQIFICPSYAEKEAPDFGRNFENYLAFLFIHGVIHLKGFDHGSRMESEEQKIRTMFSI